MTCNMSYKIFAIDYFYFSRTCCFEVLYGQLWNVLHFYVPDGSRFLKSNKNRCFFWSFHHWRKGILFFILLSCFKQCVLGLSSLLGLNVIIILPFYCNAVIAWRCLFLFSQAFTTMLAKRGTVEVFVRGCIGYHFDGLLSQLLVALHPLVLFIAMWLTSEDSGYDWVGEDVTECIVCVQDNDPFTFLSCPFSFLIGWEFYGPNYLKCYKLCAAPAASSFPQCPCSSRSSVSSSCCLCIWFRGEPTLFAGWCN